MRNISTVRLYACAAALLLLATALPASAQFSPRTLNDPATGEEFHIEGAIGLWSPSADMSIASASIPGIPPTTIDFKNDLGLEDARFREMRLVLRPARKHKFRLQFVPIEYTQQNNITRDIVFNGQLYRVGSPVASTLKWNAWRFGYEYDFLVKNRGFAGFILDAKYTDVQAGLKVALPFIDEFIHARAPIPTLGGIGRFYIVPNISITGELTGVKIPDSISEEYKAHFADLDIYGTVNLNRYLGGQVGYRSFDVGYRVEDDSGSFVVQGIYFGVVARF